jgi:hypothetical protein
MKPRNIKDDIISLRKDNKTYKEICDTLNCSKGTVSYHLSKLDWSNDMFIEKSKSNLQVRKDGAKLKRVTKHKLKMERLEKLSKTKGKNEKVCVACESVLPIENFYIRKKSKKESSYCIKCSKEQVLVRTRALKKEMVDYKGGSCAYCGYNKCLSALEFHHIDTGSKKFSLASVRKTKATKEIFDELDKCILLCANCHREIHMGNIPTQNS